MNMTFIASSEVKTKQNKKTKTKKNKKKKTNKIMRGEATNERYIVLLHKMK